MAVRTQRVEGDTDPLQVVLTDSSDTPVGLAGATVEFRMEPVPGSAGTAITGAAVVVDESAVPGDADYGKVRYLWAQDVPAGIYRAQFAVTFSDTTEKSFPTGYLEVVVVRRVGP